jgi:Glycosyl hydrolases family 2, sugar binding domain/Glycosyl hydrolases family 2/Glycosyl hydrolases family 2, TIM barrel domain
MTTLRNICLILLLALISCNNQKKQHRISVDLAGQWQFALDTAGIGMEHKWYLSDLTDSINLPGTTDLNQKGFKNEDTTTMHLNRVYKYEGVAWYRKKVIVPENFRNKHIQLFLERTKPSKIWIDSIFIGGSRILQSPQEFDVSGYLPPGEHTITIRIDNDLNLTPFGNVHIYSDETQTNWNGILGKLYLEAAPKTYISNLQVFSDIDKQKISIELEIVNQLNFNKIDVELFIEKNFNGKTTRLKSQKIHTAFLSPVKLEYDLGKESSLWDEFQQPVYHLTAVISNGGTRDSKTVPFGMRKFTVKGTQFNSNGRAVFLRGKHEGAVFPLTGYPPMDVEDWMRVFKIARSYGINHYRFHSYCPPEAAFTAADRTGIYIQAELPFWGGLESDSVAAMLREEGFAMLKAYANHPSFVMLSHGNEIWSGHDRVEKNILALKEYDDRPLYTMGSNNNIGYVAPRKCSDFFIGARTPYEYDTVLTHTRLSQAFADSRDGGILNTETPSTEVNFDYAVSHTDIPVISHEIGQYQIFPDYKEINKYTGVLRAWNLEVFRNRLFKANMAHLDSAFHKASGAWAALCYKAETEAAIRTKGLAGFQLLDLQDYPGQGTALVGILDAFMDSKNVISREEWLQSCNDVVLLLEFPKYCWTDKECFHAKAVVANYSNGSLHKSLRWEIKKQNGTVIQQGAFPGQNMGNGGLTMVGEINFDFSFIRKAEKLTVRIFIPGTPYDNSYPVWVYPTLVSIEKPQDITISENLTHEILSHLQNGGKVLLFPKTKDVEGKSYPGLFPPEFWNYGMFKSISEWLRKPVSPGTLGILTNPEHPMFNAFPTDFHTNWQWFSIIKASNSLVLDNTSGSYQPIVQVIDNLERNHKLGLIFEFKVGTGKLLVCMSRLDQIMDKPEAVQLYQSMINYMNSDDFNPEYSMTTEELTGLFTKK